MRIFFRWFEDLNGVYSKADRRAVEAVTAAFVTSPTSAVMLLVKPISCWADLVPYHFAHTTIAGTRVQGHSDWDSGSMTVRKRPLPLVDEVARGYMCRVWTCYTYYCRYSISGWRIIATAQLRRYNTHSLTHSHFTVVYVLPPPPQSIWSGPLQIDYG